MLSRVRPRCFGFGGLAKGQTNGGRSGSSASSHELRRGMLASMETVSIEAGGIGAILRPMAAGSTSQASVVCSRDVPRCLRPQSGTGRSIMTLTLGTACILAADGYVAGKQPREERGARRDSVVVRVVVCIVRSLRKEGQSGR